MNDWILYGILIGLAVLVMMVIGGAAESEFVQDLIQSGVENALQGWDPNQ